MNPIKFTQWLLAASLFLGCGLQMARGDGLFGAAIKPDNIYTSAPALSPAIRRVVVLPLAHDEARPDLTAGCEMFDPILQSELIKAKKFEVVPVGAKEMESLTGQASWTGEEELPRNFFDQLKQAHDCDAVMFCQLTTFQAYTPLATGWRLKLVDASTQKILWAADVIFDASDAAVAKDAQQFQKQQQGDGAEAKSKKFIQALNSWIYHEPAPVAEDQWTILNSPRYFGQYSLVKLLKTLPER